MALIKKIIGKIILRPVWFFKKRKEAGRVIDCFYDKKFKRKQRNLIIKDMIWMKEKYSFEYKEYCYLCFEKLTIEQRLKFVSDWERFLYAGRMNQDDNQKIFDDKTITYEYFKKYFKREQCEIKNESDFEVFADFCKKHSKFIIKPNNSAMGRGVELMTVEEIENDFKKALKRHQNGFVAEELIVQSKEMAKFHPQSCNTVRIPTIRFDDRIEIIHPFFRVGRGDSVVDNAGAGGIIVALDAETGITIAAADEKGKEYIVHPETGYDLIGYQIPRWNEAVELVKELAQVVPTNRYTGWDVALTDDGWVMVEGNARGQFVWQIATKVGFKEEIERIMKELNL